MKVYAVIEQLDLPDIAECRIEIYINKEKAIQKIEERQKELLIEYAYLDTHTNIKCGNDMIGYHNSKFNYIYGCEHTYNYADIWIEEKEIIE